MYSRNVIAAGRNLQKAVEHSKKYAGSTGKDQSAMTAAVAAYVADSLYKSINPGGIYHIEQLFSAHDILQLMEEVAHRMV